jgi:hypothetical protein
MHPRVLFLAHFFESLYLTMHWSECNNNKRPIVLQTVLVMHMFSSLASCTWMLPFFCLVCPRRTTGASTAEPPKFQRAVSIKPNPEHVFTSSPPTSAAYLEPPPFLSSEERDLKDFESQFKKKWEKMSHHCVEFKTHFQSFCRRNLPMTSPILCCNLIGTFKCPATFAQHLMTLMVRSHGRSLACSW